jgi:hypothetical protein
MQDVWQRQRKEKSHPLAALCGLDNMLNFLIAEV